jgi:hypothetical protein
MSEYNYDSIAAALTHHQSRDTIKSFIPPRRPVLEAVELEPWVVVFGPSHVEARELPLTNREVWVLCQGLAAAELAAALPQGDTRPEENRR